jgi:23S rRNA (cytidine1920-2'-O)/16S rRNA (cytidine1409-2'-O)-methyltransferase
MTRLDQALVERGLCESRERAKRAILAGQVRINAQSAHKPSDSVKPGDQLTLDADEKYVSRGGHKLEHALRHFQLDVTGLMALDLGASTGGFTDCLLQHGAAKVFAVDVGRGQFAWKLRHDPRVVVMEKTNARHLKPEHFGGTQLDTAAIFSPSPPPKEERGGVRRPIIQAKIPSPPPSPGFGATSQPSPRSGGERELATVPSGAQFRGFDLVTIDCSFISLRNILPAAIALLRPNGRIVALIKPQFEAGKAEADKGRGVISDPAVHERVLNELREFVRAQPGLRWQGVVESPLLGPAGNKEFLALIEKTS